MSRRLAYAVLFVTSVVVSACASPTAPTREDTTTTEECRSGYMGSSGRCES